MAVAVTGIGMVSPLGVGTEVTWEGLTAGRSGIRPITRFDTKGLATTFAGQVPDFDPTDFLPKKEAGRAQLFIAYAVAAAKMAVADATLDAEAMADPRTGVYAGCGIGGLDMMETSLATLEKRGPGRVSPFFIPQFIGNMAAGMVGMQLGLKGPNLCFTTACAAGTHAVGEAAHRIRDGYADVLLAGGSEGVVSRSCLAGFNAMRALSTRNDTPASASRPFDATRDGFVVGEGACFLVLERLSRARKRGAKIYAVIHGYGASCDASHMTAPAPDGEGMASCMAQALADGGVDPKAVDYINAHGTSTPLNDAYETRAIESVFGSHSRALAVSSTKSMTGHLLGAAGALEAGITALAIHHGMLPPTINLTHPDPACSLDYVPNRARAAVVRYALSNSFGFGGTNAAVLLGHPDVRGTKTS